MCMEVMGTYKFIKGDLYLLDIEKTATPGEAIQKRLTENCFNWSRLFGSSVYMIETDGISLTYEYNGICDGWIHLKKEAIKWKGQ